ncbi:MAG: type III-A CRISPR-associated protein Csm2 [Caldilineaceae bacterium SB0661_bin_32]|uniref:CRISPR system Cms protein Csm2 n=1 Tax=Caldilineaceae bacterium SB0661_bin_32 TaxID=2605255 RepID=A0A6B1D7X5_9CHLR|nr:type III-A CRISPR-associated protein Csm2 [Caldilineaceae bacterium SB0661_bin_32]
MAKISESDLKAMITKSDPASAKLLVDHAKDLGRQLKNANLTTSQIRAIFGEVRQIQAQLSIGEQERERALRKLILLKPKMAYRARRERGRGVEELTSVLDPAIDLIVGGSDQEIQGQHFQRFVDFFEAILAYHKAAGGN